jgi:uncharacterized protein YkwD
MIARRAIVVLSAAILLATALVGVWASNPEEAEATLITVETCDGRAFDLISDEKQMFDLHNQVRANKGLPLLCVHPVLTEAARAHSQEMLEKDYISHDSFDGESIVDRLVRFGYSFDDYSYGAYAENIGWGEGQKGVSDAMFRYWMESPDHNVNILNKKFLEIGVGIRRGAAAKVWRTP